MIRYDMDIHAMEPRELWPAKWRSIWRDDATFKLDDYLRHLDSEKCDVGMFLPTRALFMDGFDVVQYQEWAHEFCENSDGRLWAAGWYNGIARNLSVLDSDAPIVALPEHARKIIYKTTRPVIVHSVARLAYSLDFHVDHALAHPVDAMKFIAELGAVGETPTCNIAILECGTWWIGGWMRRMQKENLNVPWDNIWFGIDINERSVERLRRVAGSDFPHYDQQDLNRLIDDEAPFRSALEFLGMET